MGDVNKLPKWAQAEIEELRKNQSVNNVGAHVEGCHIENVGIKHSPETMQAICSVADALSANAEALKELSKGISGSAAREDTMKYGMYFSHVNANKEKDLEQE